MATATRTLLDRDISIIRNDILRLGSLVEDQIRRAVQALRERNVNLGQYVVDSDGLVNELRYKIESECLSVIARQQPTATDLRVIVAASHMAAELERMADHASGIGEIVVRMGGEPPVKPLIDIPRMSDIVCGMTHGALDAFVAMDAGRAREVVARDDEVDQLYTQVLRELITYMMADDRLIPRATYLLWVAHNLERIGDRATNVCERVIFAATGELADYKPQPPALDTQNGE